MSRSSKSFQRWLLITIALLVSLPIAAFNLLNFVGLSLGSDWSSIHATLMSLSLFALLIALISAFKRSTAAVMGALGVAALSLIASLIWEPIAEDLRVKKRNATQIQRNLDFIQSATSQADCSNGDVALIHESTGMEVRREGLESRTTKNISLTIRPKDPTQQTGVHISTTGEFIPGFEVVDGYKLHNPDVTCSNFEYASLDEMLDKVLNHYAVEHHRLFPSDPVYEHQQTLTASLTLGPVNPLLMKMQMLAVNAALKEKFKSISRYSIVQTTSGTKADGSALQESTRIVMGDDSSLFTRNGSGDWWRIEFLNDGKITTHLFNGKVSSSSVLPEMIYQELDHSLYFRGYRAMNVKAWGEPVIFNGRAAKRYSASSVYREFYQDWNISNEYIADDETGLILRHVYTDHQGAVAVKNLEIMAFDPEILNYEIQQRIGRPLGN